LTGLLGVVALAGRARGVVAGGVAVAVAVAAVVGRIVTGGCLAIAAGGVVAGGCVVAVVHCAVRTFARTRAAVVAFVLGGCRRPSPVPGVEFVLDGCLQHGLDLVSNRILAVGRVGDRRGAAHDQGQAHQSGQ